MKSASGSDVKTQTLRVPAQMPQNALRSLASTIFDQLRSEGCNTKDIISVSSELLSLVTSEIQKASVPPVC